MNRPSNQPHDPRREPQPWDDDGEMSFLQLLTALLCAIAFAVMLIAVVLVLLQTLGLFGVLPSFS